MPVDPLPGWMLPIRQALEFTHAWGVAIVVLTGLQLVVAAWTVARLVRAREAIELEEHLAAERLHAGAAPWRVTEVWEFATRDLLRWPHEIIFVAAIGALVSGLAWSGYDGYFLDSANYPSAKTGIHFLGQIHLAASGGLYVLLATVLAATSARARGRLVSILQERRGG